MAVIAGGMLSPSSTLLFFRKETERMLESFVMQIEEYLSSPERFELLGIVGIDGSPSCGVHSTYDGDWGGELTGIPDLTESIQTLQKSKTLWNFHGSVSKAVRRALPKRSFFLY